MISVFAYSSIQCLRESKSFELKIGNKLCNFVDRLANRKTIFKTLWMIFNEALISFIVKNSFLVVAVGNFKARSKTIA